MCIIVFVVIQVSRSTFEMTTPGRVYRFIDIANGAEYWVDSVVEAVKKHEQDKMRRSYVMR